MLAEAVAATGALVSAYALHVERELARSPGFAPLCDVASLGMSCSKILTSRHSRLLSHLSVVQAHSEWDISNAAFALAFHLAMLFVRPIAMRVLPRALVRSAVLCACLSSFGIGFYLAYAMYFVYGDICIVCSALYACNVLLLALAIDDFAVGASRDAKTKARRVRKKNE